jgi:hypothetical protein
MRYTRDGETWATGRRLIAKIAILLNLADTTAATATATPAPGTHKRQISEAVPRNKRLNSCRPETTPAAAPQQEASGGAQEAQGKIRSTPYRAGIAIATGTTKNARNSCTMRFRGTTRD